MAKHIVKQGECIESIAFDNGFFWETICNLPENADLKRERKDPDALVPGDAVFIPERRMKEESGATEQKHRFRRKGVPIEHEPFLIILENEKQLRIPEADYEATLADGSKRTGKLGLDGTAQIMNPPPGDVEVIFPDLDDVEAKSLAACARRAFDERNPDEIYRILEHSPEMLKMVVQTYDTYFNDYTGKGFVEDVYQEITDPDALMAVEGLLAGAGLPTHSRIEYVRWEPEMEFEEEIDVIDGRQEGGG